MGAMADTQLAPSSPSSGLSNGNRGHANEGFENNHMTKRLASSSRKTTSSATRNSDPAPHDSDSSDLLIQSSTGTSTSENKQNGIHSTSDKGENGIQMNGTASTSMKIQPLAIPNRLIDKQSRSSAPPSTVPSDVKTRSRKSLRTEERRIESEQKPSSGSPNLTSSLLRQTRSTSPMTRNNIEAIPNGLVSSRSPSSSSQGVASGSTVQRSALDEKEQQIFRTQASSQSSQILPSPPQLPFDQSYPGLAPTSVDQKGNPLPLLRTEQIAKQLLSRNYRSSKKEKHTPVREVKSEEDQIPFTQTRSREGSEITRDGDAMMSIHVLDGTSIEDEMDYAAESLDGTKDESSCKNMNEDVLTQPDSDEKVAEGLENGESTVVETEDSMMIGSEAEQNEIQDSSQIHSNSTPITSKVSQNSTQQNQMSNSSESRSNRRRRQSDHDLLDQSIYDTSIGDQSITESVESGSSRRPRAAHKRLKMQGGYYGRNPKPESPSVSILAEQTEEEGDESKVILPSNNKSSVSRLESRAASSTLDDSNVMPLTGSTIVDDDLLAQAIAADASITTPIKATQQPSITISLRNSASKNQNSKLIHTGSGLIDNGEGNNEYCETCKGVGHFICCDGCPRSFHFACINPPLDIDELPSTMGDEQDKWYCNACKAEMKTSSESELVRNEKSTTKSKGKQKSRQSSIGKNVTMFEPLFNYIEETNPTIFSLPLDVRNYFKGVATANDGSYVDSIMLRPLKINKLGVVEERDPLRLKDKNGKLILCYRCGESALPSFKPANVEQENKSLRRQPTRSSPRKSTSNQNQKDTLTNESLHSGWRKIISCDFCALHWHLDCLEPPMANMPSLSRKWMCPNHVDHAIKPIRIPKSIANSTTVHELPTPSESSIGPGKHYRMRVVNDGRIDIIPDPMDTYFTQQSSSQNGQGVNNSGKNEEKNSSILTLTIAGGSNEQRGRGLDKGWEELDIPTNMTNKSNSSSSSLNKNLKFKYRIPEKVIQLDFWSRAEIEREKNLSIYLQKLDENNRKPLDVLASIAKIESIGFVNDAGKRLVSKDESSIEETVEGIFGSQNSRILFPDAAIRKLENRSEEDDSFLVDGIRESSLRHTFVEGEYEKEFDARSLAMVSTDLTPSPNVITMKERIQEAKDAKERDKDQSTASTMNVDVDEISKLRAIQALVERKGAKALFDFLLTDDDN